MSRADELIIKYYNYLQNALKFYRCSERNRRLDFKLKIRLFVFNFILPLVKVRIQLFSSTYE